MKEIREIREIQLYTTATSGSVTLIWDKYSGFHEVSQEELQRLVNYLYDNEKQFVYFTKYNRSIHGINKSSISGFYIYYDEGDDDDN